MGQCVSPEPVLNETSNVQWGYEAVHNCRYRKKGESEKVSHHSLVLLKRSEWFLVSVECGKE